MPQIVIGGDRFDLDGRLVAESRLEEITTRAEIATLWTLVRLGQLARDGHQWTGILVDMGQRDAAEQAVRVGMLWPGED